MTLSLNYSRPMDPYIMTCPPTRVTRSARRSKLNVTPVSLSKPPIDPVASEKDMISGAVTGKDVQTPEEADQPVRKRRRKKETKPTTPQPAYTPEPAATSRTSGLRSAKSRAAITASAPSHAAAVTHREETRPIRPASPGTDAEQSLPIVPRVGMGDFYASPPDSDIRCEGRHIIDAAARYREQEQLRNSRISRFNDDETNDRPQITPPPTSEELTHPYPLHPSNDTPVYATPVSTYDDQPTALYYTTAGPSSYAAQGEPGPSTCAHRYFDESSHPFFPEDSFELQEVGLRSSQSHQNPATASDLAAEMSPSSFAIRPVMEQAEPRPPRGGPPTILLESVGGSTSKSDDKIDRAYQDGFEGLTTELEKDALGFVSNVRVSQVSDISRHC